MSDAENEKFRNDVNFRSLRQSSRIAFSSIRKKLSTVEESLRQRRALIPLENESDNSTPPTPVKDDESMIKKQRSIRKASHAEIFEQGYEFDDISNLMKTPLLRKTPEPRLFADVSRFSRIRASMSSLPSLNLNKKDCPPPAISPSARLAKRLATCKIHKSQSPKQLTLKKKLSELRLRKSKNCEVSTTIIEETSNTIR